MAQDGKSNAASPPFATPDGKPAAASGGSNGAHNFMTDPKGGSPTNVGGRDFTKENPPIRSAGADGADPTIEKSSIPAGGKIPTAAPGSVSGKIGGDSASRSPFKNLK